MRRLVENYSRMSDGELEELVREAATLTKAARQALKDETTRRGLTLQAQDAAPATAPEWRKPVTLRRFRNFLEAQLAKTILDAAGIPCFLADENTVRMDWFYSNAIGGIKLWVNEEDAEATATLLDAEIPKDSTAQSAGEDE